MGKNQSASGLTNIVQYDNNGNISFVSGSTMLMQISSSGAITTTGVISGSNALSASYAATASFVTLAQTASFVTTAQTASFVANAQSASNAVAAQTASFANAFTVAGTLTAQTLVVQTITSSVDFVTGSTKFGSLSSNTHVFTGSLYVTGALYVATGSVGVGTLTPDVFGRGDALNVGISAIGASDNMALSLNAGGSAGRGSQIYMGQGGTRHFTLSSNVTETTIGTVSSTPLRINTNDVTRLTISSNGTASFNGNVGIGTSTFTAGNGTNLEVANSSVARVLVTQTGTRSFSISAESNAFYLYDQTANATRIYVNASGNVGIGTTSVTNRLITIGAETGTQITTIPIGKFVNTGNSFSKLIIGSDNANYDAVISMDNNATLANTKLRFYIGNGTNSTAGHSNDQIVLQGDGKVGIGITNPSYKLDVNGVTQIRDTLLITKQVGNSYAQSSTSGTTSLVNTGIYYNTSIIGFGNSGTYLVTITGNPNAAGSNEYRAVIVGYINIVTGYDFGISSVIQQISWTETLNKQPPNISVISVSVVFWNGTTEATTQVTGTTTNQIRIKVSGYNSSNVGAAQDIRITKITD